jgi:predicted dehydrogenase
MAVIRLGIVGTGGMANQHAEQFAKEKSIKLAACYDIDPKRAKEFADKHKIKYAAPDLDSLLEHADAVAIVTSDASHASIALRALAANKHVICEKPLTVTLDEAREVAAAAIAAQTNGVIHMVNFSYRSSSALQRASELAKSGALGEIRHVHSYYLQSWLASNSWGNWSNGGWLWRLSTAAGSGGVLGDIGCHILDLTTMASEDLAAIRCCLKTFPKITEDGESVTQWNGTQLDANDSALIEFEFAGGGIGICHASRWATGHANSLRLEVHGTEGALSIDLDKDYHSIDLCLGKARHTNTWTTEKLKPTPTNYERFARAIETGKIDQPDMLRGAQIQAYLEACMLSSESGSWVKIPEWISL